MKNNKILKWIMPLMILLSSLQMKGQLNQAEYFFDTDPGIGNGYALSTFTVTPGSVFDSTTVSDNINIPSNLLPGTHTLYVRFANYDNGEVFWSQCEARKFHVNTQGQNIVIGEYFFDFDPGIGNGTSIALNGNLDSSDYIGGINTTGLAAGFHNLYIRVKNTQGQWSQYETKKILISASGISITQAEYFFDQDPGVGNGLSLSITGNTDSSEFIGNISTTGLNAGFHNVYIRVKKSTGEWSNYETRKIHILPSGISISKAEYFFDTDPGVGNGIQIAITGNEDSSILNGSLNTVGLSPGIHQACIRVQSTTGNWSVYEVRKIEILPQGNIIPKAEYFVDTDPGIGNGTSINLQALSIDSSEFAGGVIMDTNLSAGLHTIYIRPQDQYGHWGHVDTGLIFHHCKPPTLPTISASTVSNCGYADITLSINSGNLNSATNWYWYKNNCGGLPIDSGLNIIVTPFDTTTYYVRGEGGCVSTGDCANITIEANPSSTVQLKLFLQGYYENNSMMTSTLLNEGVGTNMLITDSLLVRLHDPITHALVAQKTALLQTNGDVVCNFCPLQGNYEISIQHRNTIETWASNSISLSNEITNYDFTTAANKAYGDNQVEIENGIFAFYSGDLNQDENIDLLDLSILDTDINNFEFGYFATDINGDGNVDLLDGPNVEDNVNNFIFVSKP